MGLCDGKPINQKVYLVKYQIFFNKKIFFICLLNFFVYKVLRGIDPIVVIFILFLIYIWI